MNWQAVANAAHLLFGFLLIFTLGATLAADREDKEEATMTFAINVVVFLLLCGVAKH